VTTAPATIQDGVVVLFEYTLSDDKGNIIETSDEVGVQAYLHGSGNVVAGLERQLAGHKTGDAFTVTVAPDEGYGFPDDSAPEPVLLTDLPAEIEEGMPIFAELEDGSDIELWIQSIDGEHAMLSQNHPLAGVTLTFDVEIKGLRAATESELTHRHAHGIDGTETHGDEAPDAPGENGVQNSVRNGILDVGDDTVH
jgi:FKBP-type peptidyl-prolyl cis-trans isomerase SlyD